MMTMITMIIIIVVMFNCEDQAIGLTQRSACHFANSSSNNLKLKKTSHKFFTSFKLVNQKIMGKKYFVRMV